MQWATKVARGTKADAATHMEEVLMRGESYPTPRKIKNNTKIRFGSNDSRINRQNSVGES